MRALLVIVAAFVFASGCAHAQQDWIDRTLVTVDVTGVWEGTITAPASNLAIERSQRWVAVCVAKELLSPK